MRHYLRRTTKLDESGKAEAAAEWAYGWCGRGLCGPPKGRVTDFAKAYSEKFSGSGKKALLELKETGHALFLVSGGIQECVETVLKENGVCGLFDGIYCNPLIADGKDGKIERLEKRTSTPGKKVSVLTEKGIDPYHAVVVGNGDFWDKKLSGECAHRIVRSYRDGFEGLVAEIEKI